METCTDGWLTLGLRENPVFSKEDSDLSFGLIKSQMNPFEKVYPVTVAFLLVC